MRIGRPPRNRADPLLAGSTTKDPPSPPPDPDTEQEWPMTNASMLFDDLEWSLASDDVNMPTSKDIFDTQFFLNEDLAALDATSNTTRAGADALQYVPPAPMMTFEPLVAAAHCRPLSATGESNSVTSSGSSDCLTCIIQLLDDMHVRNPLCNDGAGSHRNPNSRSVDMVLMRNRIAVSTLAKAVDCPCFSAQGSIHLASYLLVSAVVSGYGAILRADGKPATALSITDSVAPSPLHMGSYELSEAAQRGIRGRIVLTELKNHLEPLLERLPRFRASLADEISQATDEASMPDVAMSNTPLEVQECVLREQLRSLVSAASQIP
ncbi:hypothetical protein CBER1_00900 [Cercospora berteroae]|uniref:Aflatoxin regulatory protein domain-containing protein n=1 Tax=Cercospora berteroae TaxID=357750 RepID=A0A2S6C0Q4_9PEZI|nr:hypothetical protein CBER1_00900 [Cercospora berteroae]